MAGKRKFVAALVIGLALVGPAAPASARQIDGYSPTSHNCVPGQPCPPHHAIVVCQSASFYEGYNSATGSPYGFKRTLYYGNKVGHTRGAHPVHNGWASTFDFGPNDWGVMRYECLGGWDSW